MIALLAFFLGASSVLAQQPAPEDGRRLFEEGIVAIREERWTEAVDLLDRSRAIRETPPVVFNLGLALRGAGDLSRASDAFRRVLAITEGQARYEELRARTLAMLGTIAATRARLTIVVRGGATAVTLDGASIATADGTFPHDVDPGTHRVLASRPGYRETTREVAVAAGQSLTVEIDASAEALPPPPTPVRIDPRPLRPIRGRDAAPVLSRPHDPPRRGHDPRDDRDDDDASGGVLTAWWFWTGIAAVAVGSGIVIAIAAQPDDVPLERGSLGVSVDVLRLAGGGGR